MSEARTNYLPALVRSDVVSDWERKFCASLIAQTRKGRALTQRQAETLERIVDKFQRAYMRDDEVTE